MGYHLWKPPNAGFCADCEVFARPFSDAKFCMLHLRLLLRKQGGLFCAQHVLDSFLHSHSSTNQHLEQNLQNMLAAVHFVSHIPENLSYRSKWKVFFFRDPADMIRRVPGRLGFNTTRILRPRPCRTCRPCTAVSETCTNSVYAKVRSSPALGSQSLSHGGSQVRAFQIGYQHLDD